MSVERALASNEAGQESTALGDAAPEGLFLRKSSGLVRELGFKGVFGLNLGALSVVSPLSVFIIMLTLFPGTNLTLAILGGGILTGLMAFVYTQLAATLPRAGGDYVYQSRIFHPAVGAWVGGGLLVLCVYIMASVCAFYIPSFVSFGISAIGTALHSTALLSFATTIATQTGTFIAGLVILALLFGVSAASTELVGRISWITVLLSVLAVVIIIGELAFHSQSAFRTAFGAHSYDAVLSAAATHGFTPGFSGSATFNALPWAFQIFGSFWFAVYIGGEIKRPAQTLKWGNFAAIGAGIVIVVGVWLAMQSVASSHFLQASAALQAASPASYAKISGIATAPQNYAVLLSGDPVTKILIGLGIIAAIVPSLLAFMAATSRILFAMSFDRLLPEQVARVSGARRVPAVALTVTAIATVALFTLVQYVSGFTNAFRNVILIGALIAFMASVAAVALPYVRRDLYEASPKAVRGRWLGLEPIVWLGGASALFEGLVCYLTLTKGEYSGGYVTSSIILLICTALLGPVLYFGVRILRGREGIDLTLAMHELPPD